MSGVFVFRIHTHSLYWAYLSSCTLKRRVLFFSASAKLSILFKSEYKDPFNHSYTTGKTLVYGYGYGERETRNCIENREKILFSSFASYNQRLHIYCLDLRFEFISSKIRTQSHCFCCCFFLRYIHIIYALLLLHYYYYPIQLFNFA